MTFLLTKGNIDLQIAKTCESCMLLLSLCHVCFFIISVCAFFLFIPAKRVTIILASL